ncbi:hypothetical protein SS50377_25142 [Spironucleus salmonicida]|uniref:Uncharacterized protein n=1 Tax=Spironucleus salmonicida TaxID=348837 RepID=A0A9P8LRJ5_9EUKA|nr:hypothetical protein SS50377_25142 [Spironucleus salmonicida]
MDFNTTKKLCTEIIKTGTLSGKYSQQIQTQFNIQPEQLALLLYSSEYYLFVRLALDCIKLKLKVENRKLILKMIHFTTEKFTDYAFDEIFSYVIDE